MRGRKNVILTLMPWNPLSEQAFYANWPYVC